MKRGSLIIIIIASIVVFCARKEEAIKGEPGGKLVIGTTDFPSTISPLTPSVFSSNEILDLLFLRLHRIDPVTGRMKPELASSWEFSEDLTAITYYLRTDVKWWDGKPVSVEDLLYTYEKMKDPKINYPNIASLRFIKNVEIVGKNAIKFTFEKVYADLLTDSDIMPIPKHIYEEKGADFGSKIVVGNGPYKIKEWNPASGIILTANDDYYRGRPPLDEIIIKIYTDPDEMITAFSRGDLDLVLNIAPSPAKELAKNENIGIDSRPGNSYLYIAWNLRNPYLQDKEIREALSMAVDKQKILADVFQGMGTICLGPLPPSSWGYNSNITPIEYNLSKAREVLRKKGFTDVNQNEILDKDGKDWSLTLITNIESPERVNILDFVASDLRSLGIKVNIRTLDAGSFIQAIINKNFDGFVMGWSVSEKIDPTVYWNSDPTKGRYNFIGYKNSVIDSLIDVGVTMLNRKKAKEIWAKFQKIIYEDQPYTFLVVPNEISANYKRVKGTAEGIKLASAYTYWIPESERRVAIAKVIPPAPTPSPAPTLEKRPGVKPPAPTPPLPPAVVAPEKILEAAAKKETTTTVTPPPLEVLPKAPLITTPVPIKEVKPKYPESARVVGATGRVVVRVVVGTDGKVKAATILSSFGNPACEAAALAAAKQWEFKPATKDGEPFEHLVSIPFTFKP